MKTENWEMRNENWKFKKLDIWFEAKLQGFIGVWSDGADGFDCPKASPWGEVARSAERVTELE